MPESLEELVMLQPPTAERPLLGTIVLVVEDSRHACEAIRLICQRSGARIRRAESLASAERHLRSYRPRIAVVDLGLPDGSGLELISRLANADVRIDGIIATSGDESLGEAALQAGADTFLPKPLGSVSEFQREVLKLLPEENRPARIARPNRDSVRPDAIALRDDLSLAAELLSNATDPQTLDYVSGFLAGLAICADRPKLAELAEDVNRLAHGETGQNSLGAITQAIAQEASALEPV